MRARHFTELIVWQIADGIRQHVFAWTGKPPFSREHKRRAQIEDAIDSVCRNISEGFSGTHAQFAWFLEIGQRSLNEVADCTRSAQLRGYVNLTQPRCTPKHGASIAASCA
jgi:four helix bundle protein